MTAFPLESSLIRIRHIPLKRIFDIAFSFSMMIIGLPFFFLLAILVRFSSKGPIFYAQQRVGRGGRLFSCYKFRTMYPDADLRLQRLLQENSALKLEWERAYKLKKDPRVTPIGRFLRKTSLDELPQFWNVLKGDLSIVGPRPVTKEEVDQYIAPRHQDFLMIRPGLTGPWQVSGRSNLSYAERIEMDLSYVESRTFLGDLWLILKTIPAVFTSRGAY